MRVYSEHDDQSKGYKVKSRLFMRGETEENTEKIRVDSSTAHKDSIKLALSIAANEDFDIISADVKAAFLQGRQLDRNVFVIPPPEANHEERKSATRGMASQTNHIRAIPKTCFSPF